MKGLGISKNEARCNIGAVRLAHRYDLVPIKPVGCGGAVDKAMELRGLKLHILFVEYSFSESLEESRKSVFQNRTPRTEHCSALTQTLGEGQEAFFVSARAVKHEKRHGVARLRRPEDVNEIGEFSVQWLLRERRFSAGLPRCGISGAQATQEAAISFPTIRTARRQ